MTEPTHQQLVDDAAKKVIEYLQKHDPEVIDLLRKNHAAKTDDLEKSAALLRGAIESGVDHFTIFGKDMTAGDAHVTTALGNQNGSKAISFSEALLNVKKPKVAPDAAPATTVAVKSEFPLRVTKFDAEQQKIFGWAYISVRDGELIVDKQDDAILPDDLEKAAHDFALYFRSQGDMHQIGPNDVPVQRGRMIESMVFTPEKLAKAGLSAIDPDTGEQLFGWFVGFKVDDQTLWDAHKRGERPEFSIGGKGRRVEIAAE